MNQPFKLRSLTTAKPAVVRVYVAGPVIEPDDQPQRRHADDPQGQGRVCFWRTEIFRQDNAEEYLELNEQVSVGRFQYAGPTIEALHGWGCPKLASRCLEQVRSSRVLFAWIDRKDTIGTVAEIGAAFTLDKPIFIAFANKELSNQFYFAKQLATMAVIACSATDAWEIFTRWYDVHELRLP